VAAFLLLAPHFIDRRSAITMTQHLMLTHSYSFLLRLLRGPADTLAFGRHALAASLASVWAGMRV
jgi:hypothetical protein